MKWLYIHLLLQHFSCGYFKYSIKCIRSQNYFVIHFFQLILFQRWNTAWSPWKVSIRNSEHIFVIWIDMKNCLTNKLSQYKINWTLFFKYFRLYKLHHLCMSGSGSPKSRSKLRHRPSKVGGSGSWPNKLKIGILIKFFAYKNLLWIIIYFKNWT